MRNTIWTILCTVLVGTAAEAADTFISFDVPGATSTSAFRINNNGAVVGNYVDSAGMTHGYLLKDGAFTTIDYPDAVFTSASGINSQGDIVGCHIDDLTRMANAIGCHGYLLHQGVFTPIDYPGKYGAILQGINDAGQIVGSNHDDDGPGGVMTDDMHGFLLSNGSFTQLTTGHTQNNALTADGGATLGQVTANGVTHGYLASNDTLVPFDFPFSITTVPLDMSPSGEDVVGWYRDGAKTMHGFLLRPGYSFGTFGVNPQLGMTGPFEFVTIDYPGATATQAVGVNPRGDVVGLYIDAARKTHAFLLVRGHRPD
jgi:uncharacterized membrane protein